VTGAIATPDSPALVAVALSSGVGDFIFSFPARHRAVFSSFASLLRCFLAGYAPSPFRGAGGRLCGIVGAGSPPPQLGVNDHVVAQRSPSLVRAPVPATKRAPPIPTPPPPPANRTQQTQSSRAFPDRVVADIGRSPKKPRRHTIQTRATYTTENKTLVGARLSLRGNQHLSGPMLKLGSGQGPAKINHPTVRAK